MWEGGGWEGEGWGVSEAGIKILNCRKLICISNLNYSKVWWFEHCPILGILISLLDFVASRYLRPRYLASKELFQALCFLSLPNRIFPAFLLLISSAKELSSLFAFYLFQISFSSKELFQPLCFLSSQYLFTPMTILVFLLSFCS